ncbi:MAG: sporulation initiation factor Spo0A C-terminal domain-containing protein [Christensenellaceae bacterium]|jgi:two-component system response regulator (stage 0 sporulation protein A)|nr:sporulation initiation factor Spo0A C-terminal domain-containing protein [Christensenellaceae bacterium]
MSEKVKLFISEDSHQGHHNKIKELIAAHPEFELCTHPSTRAGQVLNSNLLMKRVSDIFITVGIPAHIQGYKYLREAIKLTIEQPGIINCITKQLYPTIAKQFATTPSKVERAIRHAIEVGWARGKIENINNIFGVKVYGHNDRPTNGEFIALIADKMMVDSVS